MLEEYPSTEGGNNQKVATVATPRPECVMIEIVGMSLNSHVLIADCAQIMLYGENPELECVWHIKSPYLPAKPEDWVHLEPYGDNMRFTIPLTHIGAIRFNCELLED